MADASYRKLDDGRMYCHQTLTIGTEIMGANLTKSDDSFKLSLAETAEADAVTVTFSGGDLKGYEYVFEASSGVFDDGTTQRPAFDGATAP